MAEIDDLPLPSLSIFDRNKECKTSLA